MPDASGLCSYVVKRISQIITTHGPRRPGSVNERAAQADLAQELGGFADEVSREPFELHPLAFLGWMPFAGLFMAGSVACFGRCPIVGLLLSFTVFLVAFLQLGRYRQAIDWLFPKATSVNVLGKIKSQGPRKRILILTGHMDAAFEWPLNYLHPIALKGVLGSSLLGLLWVLGTDFWAVGYRLLTGEFWTSQWVELSRYPFLPGFVALLFFNNFCRTVPGANDNLTGVFAAMAMAKKLKEENRKLENTELWILSTGCEEAGLRGAKAFVKVHGEELRATETLVLSLETFHDLKFFGVYDRDLNGTVHHDERACRLLDQAGKAQGLSMPRMSAYVGSSDGTAFTQAKIPTVTFVGMDPGPPRYYHTRLDDVDNLDPQAIQAALGVIEVAMRLFDQNGLGPIANGGGYIREDT
jgi:hypothetical protein